MRVDAHHHLWDTSLRSYPRLSGAGTEPLQGHFDVDDLTALTDAAGIEATVAVEAACDLRETRELLEVCATAPLVRGVVGWVDLTDPGVSEVLNEFVGGPGNLVAVRHPAENEPDPDWLARPEVLQGIAAVGKAGLAHDLLVTPTQLAAAEVAARSLPEVRFVLDHLGKPAIMRSPSPEDILWQEGVTALAALPNVCVKLSGMVTEACWSSWKTKDLVPFVEEVLELFGPKRTMFGSDWPVCTLAADHATVVRTAEELLSGLSPDERRRVMGGTAVEWYRLDPLETSAPANHPDPG